MGLEPVLAGLVALVGIALTSFGAFTHTATAMAPGAALAFLGGGWLGNSLARFYERGRGKPAERAQ